MIQPTRTPIRAEEYYQLPEYQQHALIQLIDGEVIIAMPPILKHQILVKKILYFLTSLEAEQGGLALVAPTEVRLSDENIFEPDVFYIAPLNLSIAQQDDKRIIGAPDLVVEVLSPGTAKYDRQEKYQAYQQYGVREYWIVDPSHDVLEVWTRDSEGRFKRQGAYASGDTFDSLVLTTDVSVKAILDV